MGEEGPAGAVVEKDYHEEEYFGSIRLDVLIHYIIPIIFLQY